MRTKTRRDSPPFGNLKSNFGTWLLFSNQIRTWARRFLPPGACVAAGSCEPLPPTRPFKKPAGFLPSGQHPISSNTPLVASIGFVSINEFGFACLNGTARQNQEKYPPCAYRAITDKNGKKECPLFSASNPCCGNANRAILCPSSRSGS